MDGRLVGTKPWLPPRELLSAQSAGLDGVRSRALRQLEIARRGPVLDLGAGFGAVAAELARRAQGPVYALDKEAAALRCIDAAAVRVAGDAFRLPFADGAFDLVFTQFALLWMKPLDAALAETVRVLAPHGDLLLIEPDFGGMMEWPDGAGRAGLWRDVLERCGAELRAGSKVAAWLRSRGHQVRVDLVQPSDRKVRGEYDAAVADQLLATLPLEEAERQRLAAPATAGFVYLPVLCIQASSVQHRPMGKDASFA